MSKNFNLLYVFTALLLQFFVTTLLAQPHNKNTNHPANLIKPHVLIKSPSFNKQTKNILQTLSIDADCQLLDSKMVNAFSLSDGALVISYGLLKLTQNQDQLAHILAHEYAHNKLKHFQVLASFIKKPPLFFPKTKLQKLRKHQEFAADTWANDRLKNHGYDPNQIHHLWQHLSQFETETKWSDHANLSQRINKQSLQVPLVQDGSWQQMIHDLSQR